MKSSTLLLKLPIRNLENILVRTESTNSPHAFKPSLSLSLSLAGMGPYAEDKDRA